MALSLCVTAAGTARFVASLGYDVRIGYAVGAIFDAGKEILPLGLLPLWSRRAWGRFGVLGTAWIALVIFSCLATHGTVSAAIWSIERAGTWKMEVRSNAKAELEQVEQQLAALSRPIPPRPASTVRQALAGERVPVGVWKDSEECNSIQESAHLARACAHVVQLRRELAAAQDYERLSARAAELRKELAEAPIVATMDPLPMAFAATLGRVLPLSGTEGVATLVTMVVELVTCFGLAALMVLSNSREPAESPPREADDVMGQDNAAAKNLPMAPLAESAHIVRFPVVQESSKGCPPMRSGGSSESAQSSAGRGFGQTRRQEYGRGLGQTGPAHATVSRLAREPTQGGIDHQAAEKALGEFVALLERHQDARATGSELAEAYAAQRASRGWPELKSNVFGKHLKAAVAAEGGRKIKSGSQMYLGFRLPAPWRAQLACSL